MADSLGASEAFLLLAAAFGPLAFGCVEPWSLAILKGLLLASVFFGATGGLAAASPSSRGLLAWAILPLLSLSGLQYLNASPLTGPSGLWPSTGSSYLTGQALQLAALYAGLFWSASRVFRSEAARRRFLWLLFFLGLAVAAIGLFQLAEGTAVYGFRPARYGRSPFGPFFNRAHAASMMSLSWLAGGGLFLSRFFRSRRDHASGAPLSELVSRQLFLLIILAVIGWGIIKAANRGAALSLLAAGSAAVLLALLSAPKKYIAFALLIACAAQFPAQAFSLTENPITQRVAMYRGGLKMLGDAPVFGSGLGSLISGFPYYQDPYLQDLVDHVHSDWLELAVESGLLGFTLFTAAISIFGFKIYRAWKDSASAERRCLLGGAMAAAAAFGIHQLEEFSFHIPANAVLIIAILAWLSGETAQAPGKPAPRPAPASSLAIGACVIALAAAAARPAAAAFWISRAHSLAPQARASAWSKAYAWDPNPDYLYELARHYWTLADENPEASEDFLRSALKAAAAALRQDPLNRQTRELACAALWRLDRREDAQEIRQGGLL